MPEKITTRGEPLARLSDVESSFPTIDDLEAAHGDLRELEADEPYGSNSEERR